MNGQTTLFNEKQKIADDFIERINPYGDYENLDFDMRGYSKYVKEHNIPGNNIPEEVMNMFKLS